MQQKIEMLPNTYEKITNVRLITDRLNSFAELEHMEQLKNVLMPKLVVFSNKVDDFFESNIEMRECIKQFDIALSMKANRDQFNILETHLDSKFIMHKHYKTMINLQ